MPRNSMAGASYNLLPLLDRDVRRHLYALYTSRPAIGEDAIATTLFQPATSWRQAPTFARA